MRRGGCGVWGTHNLQTLLHTRVHIPMHTHTHMVTHALTGLMKKHFLIIRRYYLRYMSGFDAQMVNHIALVRDTVLNTLQYHIHTHTHTHTHTHKYTHLANTSVPR